MSADPIARACGLFDRAVDARERGCPGAAKSLGARALKLLEAAEGPDHPDVANVLLHLAGTAEDRADYAAAEPLYRRAVDIMEAISNNDPDLARLRVQAFSGLGNLLRTLGRYAEAERPLCRAVAVAKAAFGPNDLQVATALNNLGVLYKFNGQFAKGERVYRRALRIVEKACKRPLTPALSPSEGERVPAGRVRGPSDDVTLQSFLATLYHNLGGLEHERGRHERGEPFARRSVELRQKALGPDHPDVAADVAALAALLDGQGKFDEAEKLYHRALSIFKRVHGPEHYEVAVNFNNLAAIRHHQGRLAEAERLYRRALHIKEKVLGHYHPDVAMTLNNLAVTCQARGHFAEAGRLFLRALKIFKKALGPKHPKVALCRDNYVGLQQETRRS